MAVRVAISPALEPRAGARLVADGVTLAARLPDLVVAARRVATTALHGLHGRRRAGPGENFWQYRHYSTGENSAAIDWRRSGRDDHLYIREQEWESAHTIWLWADRSASMMVRSDLSATSKRDRAIILMLALADTLVRAGERVGLLGLTRPMASHFVVDRFAESLLAAERKPAESLPPPDPVARFSQVILFTDALDHPDLLIERFSRIASAGARLQLVQILDPVEEIFPFDGRTEFVDPETGARFTAGRAEAYRQGYGQALEAHRLALQDFLGRNGHHLLCHHTDRPANEPLLALGAYLRERASFFDGSKA